MIKVKINHSNGMLIKLYGWTFYFSLKTCFLANEASFQYPKIAIVIENFFMLMKQSFIV